ncbi:hypothetical protein Cadr_000031197 [Camelus dromedarius]|uniref:Uncharacterized protein n=1 Tax=Camelus dromedarius TaxID=9838 RepID=A0A5N4BXU5_CAMDR|nr:hypothetical protein Cadr_000031197 [Camelus dromedarius]
MFHSGRGKEGGWRRRKLAQHWRSLFLTPPGEAGLYSWRLSPGSSTHAAELVLRERERESGGVWTRAAAPLGGQTQPQLLAPVQVHRPCRPGTQPSQGQGQAGGRGEEAWEKRTREWERGRGRQPRTEGSPAGVSGGRCTPGPGQLWPGRRGRDSAEHTLTRALVCCDTWTAIPQLPDPFPGRPQLALPQPEAQDSGRSQSLQGERVEKPLGLITGLELGLPTRRSSGHRLRMRRRARDPLGSARKAGETMEGEDGRRRGGGENRSETDGQEVQREGRDLERGGDFTSGGTTKEEAVLPLYPSLTLQGPQLKFYLPGPALQPRPLQNPYGDHTRCPHAELGTISALAPLSQLLGWWGAGGRSEPQTEQTASVLVHSPYPSWVNHTPPYLKSIMGQVAHGSVCLRLPPSPVLFLSVQDEGPLKGTVASSLLQPVGMQSQVCGLAQQPCISRVGRSFDRPRTLDSHPHSGSSHLGEVFGHHHHAGHEALEHPSEDCDSLHHAMSLWGSGRGPCRTRLEMGLAMEMTRQIPVQG